MSLLISENRVSTSSGPCFVEKTCFGPLSVLVSTRSQHFQMYSCNLQRCAKEMTYAASGPHDASRGQGAQEQHGSLLFTKGSTESFAAFLEEFSDGSWHLLDTGEMRSILSYRDDYHECPESYSKVFDTAAATSPGVDATSPSIDTAAATSPSVVTTADASPSPPTANGCGIAKARPSGSSTETFVDSSSFAEKPGTAVDAPRALEEIFLSTIILHSSVRKITNATYLRRMHLSRDDAAGLFPEFESILNIVFTMKGTSRREYSPPIKKGTCVYIQDVEERRWPVVLECLRTAGQRHVRFNKGWAEMCSANGVSIGKCFRLARWKQGPSSSQSAIVTLSID